MEALDQLQNLRTGTLGTHPPVQPRRTQDVKVVLSDDEYKDQLFKMRLDEITLLRRISHMLYDYSKPVDENTVTPELTFDATSAPLTIQPDYTKTELYTALFYSLPLGCTSATLTIGTSRVIPLYSGTALTVQQVESFNGLNILAGPDEKRLLTLTGVLTSPGYLGLMGHCVELDGAR